MSKYRDMLNVKRLEMDFNEFDDVCKKREVENGLYFNMIDFFWYCRDRLIQNINEQISNGMDFEIERSQYAEIMDLEDEINDINEILLEKPDIIGVYVPFGYPPLKKFEFIWRKEQ